MTKQPARIQVKETQRYYGHNNAGLNLDFDPDFTIDI